MQEEYENEFEDEYESEEEYEEARRRTGKIICLVLALLLLLGGIAYGIFYVYSQHSAAQGESEIATIVQTTQPAAKVEIPIDFDALQKKNDEIYAWITVPGTKVDYPIVQSKTDDNFYLKHSATDKTWQASGAIYTESANTRSFKDRVTVIYGHNGYSDTMFTTLHRFEKGDFFKEHSKFYIYTPKAKLTYEIISAFKYDNRHIMNSFAFHMNNDFETFLQTVQHPESNNKQIRESFGRELNLDDHIVVLSTCITNQKSNRYLVCGVLVNNEEIN